MPTDGSADRFEFARVEGRDVIASFDGGPITSDAGALLLGATDRSIGLVRRFAACFTDHRAADQVEHSVAALVGQRVLALALGDEDLVDHDQLRHDPALAAVTGKLAARRSDCAALAGKSPLNRLEHAPAGAPTRYHKIGHDGAAIERLFVELFLDAPRAPPEEIVLDLDASRANRQRLRLRSSRGLEAPAATTRSTAARKAASFTATTAAPATCRSTSSAAITCWSPSGFARSPGGMSAELTGLRRSNLDASAGAVAEVAQLTAQIRAHWPQVRIILRADSGFAREALMSLRSRSDRLLWRRSRKAAGARPTGSTMCSAWPATPACWASSPRSLLPRRPRPDGPATRPGVSRTSVTSVTRPSTAGAARGGSWAKPSSWWAATPSRAPTHALW